VGKKHGRKTVKIGPPASPEDFAAEAAGKAIRFSQRDTLAHMLETAIELWFKDSDPLSIHLIGEAVYRCLDDLRAEMGIIRSKVGHDQFTLVYDYLRHAWANRDAELLFPRGANRWLLFEAVNSFEKYFRNISPTMRAFQIYFALHCFDRPPTSAELLEFLPEKVPVETFLNWSRAEFLDKALPLFAGAGRPASSLWAFRKAHLPKSPREFELP